MVWNRGWYRPRNRDLSTEKEGDAEGFFATECTEVAVRDFGKPFITKSLLELGALGGCYP